ncbi:MAG TPA: FecR domain-containing protein [Steroidobacteraceae bacterium]|jgi:transmembrane sensor
MRERNTHERARASAWQLLESVRQHEQVGQWLAESDARRASNRKPWANFLFWGIAASIALVICIAVPFMYRNFGVLHFETGIGEQRDLLLADGSRISMNTETALTVQYSKDLRKIELEHGEAFFAVKHDQSRPFDVTAGETLTRAVGTEFNVDLRPSQVTVTVLDGTVRVSSSSGASSSANPILTAAIHAPGSDIAVSKGQAVQFRSGGRATREESGDIGRIDAWRTRRLEFNDTPLPQAVQEFNRYSTIHLTIGSPELELVHVSGVFRIGDSEGFLYSLREALGIQTQATKTEVVLTRSNH